MTADMGFEDFGPAQVFAEVDDDGLVLTITSEAGGTVDINGEERPFGPGKQVLTFRLAEPPE